MIKTFLKHWIYEICIAHFFDMVFKNFKSVHSIRNVKVGDKFRLLIVRNDSAEVRYYRPTVIRTEKDRFTIIGYAYEEEIGGDDEIYKGVGYEVDIYIYDDMQKYIE